MATKTDYYLPQTHFTSLGGLTPREFDNIGRTGDPLVRPTADGYPVFGIMQHIFSKLKEMTALYENLKTEQAVNPADPSDDRMQDLKMRKEEQLLLQITLKNISLLKLFILKETASARVTATLAEVASYIKTGIVQASLEIGGEIRVNQEIITKHFVAGMDLLYANAEKVEWDDEDDADKIRKKLSELARDDRVLTSLIERAYAD